MFYNYKELNLKNEIWKNVNDWEDFYQISNFGRVKVKQRTNYYDLNLGKGIQPKNISEKIRKPKLNKRTGYLIVGLNGKGKSKNVTIHSMVARAFIENYKPEGIGKGKCVNHKDGNKLNNNVENLEVISFKENSIHAFKIGLRKDNIVTVYNGNVYYSRAEMRRTLKIGNKNQNKLLNGQPVKIHNHKIKYQNIEYYSKTEMRRKLNISEKKQRKLIESGEAVVLNFSHT